MGFKACLVGMALSAGCTSLSGPSAAPPDAAVVTDEMFIGDPTDPGVNGENACQRTFYMDFDGDGLGNPQAKQQACVVPFGYVEIAGDCDDNCPDCAPVDAEVCDGVDNDCDDMLDEDTEVVCGMNRGICTEGVQRCLDGVMGDCEGGVGALVEACDGVLDEDCDGSVDEMCGCEGSEARPCGVAMGTCMQGQQQCTGGVWGACEGATEPETEACDGLDNDCDGVTDESVQSRGCGQTQGACTAGVEECVSGAWVCTPGTEPSDESCDGLDNDCDGMTDEGLVPRPCAGAQGLCMTGVESCVSGTWGACSVSPTAEVCDGKADEDCDGMLDNGCTCMAGATDTCGESDVGECQLGSRSCQDGQWGDCMGSVGKTSETCDSKDNDCDGLTDEGVQNACGACGPVPSEACDSKDNDCDGLTDEGAQNACGACGSVPSETCDGTDNDCDGLTDEGVQNACGACGAIPFETCDGRDNDCDNKTDEGVLNACGTCGSVPSESCDGRDNDCDGKTDEGVQNVCGGCGSVPAETCDQRDNDCDGRTDEGVQNACGACGAVPRERCDGVDNDCDGRNDAVDADAQADCGNSADCDGLQCVPHCGNGLPDVGEPCDPKINPYQCTSTCEIRSYGLICVDSSQCHRTLNCNPSQYGVCAITCRDSRDCPSVSGRSGVCESVGSVSVCMMPCVSDNDCSSGLVCGSGVCRTQV